MAKAVRALLPKFLLSGVFEQVGQLSRNDHGERVETKPSPHVGLGIIQV